jgi:hypothetical protein
MLMGDMSVLVRTKDVKESIRLNRAAYRRVSSLANFTRCEVMRANRVVEAWVTAPEEEQMVEQGRAGSAVQ